jgi:hypothetical protein
MIAGKGSVAAWLSLIQTCEGMRHLIAESLFSMNCAKPRTRDRPGTEKVMAMSGGHAADLAEILT